MSGRKNMKKKTIRLGAAILAALMICSSLAGFAVSMSEPDSSIEESYAPQDAAETENVSEISTEEVDE